MGRQAILEESVREVLARTTCAGNKAILPQGLERKLYQQVNDALGRAGGAWRRGEQAHVFEGDAQAAVDRLLNGEKLPDRNPLDFYATPPDIADMLVEALRIDWKREPRILEPSVGEGALVEALVRANRSKRKWHLTVVEIDGDRFSRFNRTVDCSHFSMAISGKDFLQVWFGAVPPFDYVAMNPPFTAASDSHAYMAHIETAIKLLKPGGRLAAIAPSGCVHGTSLRHQGFRALLTGLGAEFRALPPKAFQTSGTGVSSVMIVLETSAEKSALVAEPATGKDEESMPTAEVVPEHSERNMEQEVLLLPIEMLKPSKLNPRREFDEGQMQKLRDAIRFEGILTALTVRPLPDDTYEIVAGERRYRAASDLRLDVVPVIVRNVTDRQLVEMALSENMNREDLTPIDEAYAFSSLTSLGASQAEIAERIRKDVSYVSNTLRLLKLPKTYQDLMVAGELTRAHGIALCGLVVADLGHEIGPLVNRVQAEKLTSRQVEQEVARIKAEHERELAAERDKVQPRLDADVPSATATTPPAPATGLQAELTTEGDVVFPVDPTSSSVEEGTSSPATPEPTTPSGVSVVDRRSSATTSPSAPAPVPPKEAASAPVSAGQSPAPPAPAAFPTPPSTQTPTASPQASAPSGAMATCLLPKELADWLWDIGFNSPQEALERLRLLNDAAMRQDKTLITWLDQLIEEN